MNNKNNIVSSVLTLMSGSAFSQAIPILISPILTRLFSSSQFGELALFMSIVNVCASVANGKYSASILLPKKKKHINDLIFLNLLISFLFAGLLYLLIFIHIQTKAIQISIRDSFLFIIPLVVFVVSLQQIYMAVANKFERYNSIAFTKGTQSLTSSLSNVSLGYLKFGAVGLVISSVLGFITSTSYLYNKAGFSFRINEVRKDRLLTLAKTYKNFPLFTMPQSLLHQLVVQVPVFFIQDVYTISMLGFYALSHRVLTLPSVIISSSIGQVYYKQATDYFAINKKEELHKTTKALIFKIFSVSFLVAIAVFSFLPDLFSLFFGQQWRESGIIAQYLLIYLVPAFSISPFTQVYLASNNNRFLFFNEMIRFGMLLCLFILGKKFEVDLKDFFLYFALIHTFCYAIIVIPILNKKSFIWK